MNRGRTLQVTLDTDTLDHRGRIDAACAGLDVELAYTTVTDRETEGTSRATSRASVTETGVWGESKWGQFVYSGVPETAVLGEWRLGEAALGRPKRRRFVVEQQIGGTWARASELGVMVRADAEAWAMRFSDRGRVARVGELDRVSPTTTFDEAEREALADEARAEEEFGPEHHDEES